MEEFTLLKYPESVNEIGWMKQKKQRSQQCYKSPYLKSNEYMKQREGATREQDNINKLVKNEVTPEQVKLNI